MVGADIGDVFTVPLGNGEQQMFFYGDQGLMPLTDYISGTNRQILRSAAGYEFFVTRKKEGKNWTVVHTGRKPHK